MRWHAADGGLVQVVFHFDEDPRDFATWLFGASGQDAVLFSLALHQRGRTTFGRYPPGQADKLLEAALARVRAANWDLKITSQAATAGTNSHRGVQFEWSCEALGWHFASVHPDDYHNAADFAHMRADIRVAIDRLFASPLRFFGIDEDRYDKLSIARLMRTGRRVVAGANTIYGGRCRRRNAGRSPTHEKRQRSLHQGADAAHRAWRDRAPRRQSVIANDIEEALDDMLFSGGRLNIKLLGGAQKMLAG